MIIMMEQIMMILLLLRYKWRFYDGKGKGLFY